MYRRARGRQRRLAWAANSKVRRRRVGMAARCIPNITLVFKSRRTKHVVAVALRCRRSGLRRVLVGGSSRVPFAVAPARCSGGINTVRSNQSVNHDLLFRFGDLVHVSAGALLGKTRANVVDREWLAVLTAQEGEPA